MVLAHTTDTLVSQVRTKAMLPDADGRLSSADILDLAQDEIRTTVSDLLIGTRAQFWTTAHDDVATVSGTALYDVPPRALASGVSDVLIVNGDEQWSAPEVSLEDAHRYRQAAGPWASPYGYAWRDDRIELLPAPRDATYSVRFLYPIRPPKLVPVSECRLVDTYNTVSGHLQLQATVPSAWDGTQITFDVVRGDTGRARHLNVVGDAVLAELQNLGFVSFEVEDTDYVCLAGESCVPAIPNVVWPVLVDATVIRALTAIGDSAAIGEAERLLGRSVSRAMSLLSPRNRGARKRIIAHHSPLRRGRFR